MKNNVSTTGGNININYSTEMLSLYEYLGEAAGAELGREVYKAAKDAKVQVTSQEISNTAYQGKVMMYPKAFLDAYFRNPANTTLANEPNDDLPF